MKIKVNEEELKKIKFRDKVLCECDYCNKDFLKNKNDLFRKIKNGGDKLFCSTKCSNFFLNEKNGYSEERKNNISKGLKEFNKLKLRKHIFYDYKCITCEKEFKSKKIRIDRMIKCFNCRKKRIVYDKNEIVSIYDLSSRTVQKLIKRAKLKCVICGWDKTTLDIHHIYGRKIEDANNHKNLVCLCPNCHRLAHEKKIEKNELEKVSIYYVFQNWKDFYNDFSFRDLKYKQ